MEVDSKKRTNELITKKVLPKFFVSLLVLFAGMVVGAFFIPPKIAIFMPIVAIVLLLIALFAKSKPRKRTNRKNQKGKDKKDKFDFSSSRMNVSMTFVYFLAFILGIGMYPAIAYYVVDMGVQMVLVGVGITTVIFGSLATYAFFTKRDFSSWGAFLFVALLALILLSIIGLFFIEVEMFYLVLSFMGILVFSGYILYDISVMKQMDFTEEDVPLAVLNLLLDFINMVLDILRIMSIFKN